MTNRRNHLPPETLELHRGERWRRGENGFWGGRDTNKSSNIILREDLFWPWFSVPQYLTKTFAGKSKAWKKKAPKKAITNVIKQ